MKNLVDEVEVAIPYGTRLFMVIRHPERVLLRLCAPSTFSWTMCYVTMYYVTMRAELVRLYYC